MNTSKIYVGYTKDGKKRLLYKKQSLFKDFTEFIDLKERKVFTYLDVMSDTLVPYNKCVTNRKHMSKRKVIKTYKKDEKLLYHVDNLFVGDKYIINFSKNYSMTLHPIENNKLFIKYNDEEYKEMGTNDVYQPYSEELENGEIFVHNLRNVKTELCYGTNERDSGNNVLRRVYKKYNNE